MVEFITDELIKSKKINK